MTPRAGLLYPLFFAVLLAACTKISEDGSAYNELRIFRDPETGCQFVANISDKSPLTPRMGADGKQICRPVGGAK